MTRPYCGGCLGLGSHASTCRHRPGYRYRDVLAQQAEDVGDSIGGNDPEAANACYRAAALLRDRSRA